MNTLTRLLIATGLMVTATAASAHAGHDAGSGFTSGLLHPMLGLDHLLAMAAIGFWSVRQSATLKNSTPLFLIGGMILGAGIGFSGMPIPGVETGIALTVMLAGVLIATLARLPTAVGGSLVAAFMMFHGYAHAAEMPLGAHFAAYTAGFAATTVAIAFVGRGLGALLLTSDSLISRAIGAGLVGGGLMFAA
jgi:urease accessory protein